jgi:hypothetical protein
MFSVLDPQTLADQQKSASFISTNTTDDNDKLMHSTVSVGGQTEEEEGHTQGKSKVVTFLTKNIVNQLKKFKYIKIVNFGNPSD